MTDKAKTDVRSERRWARTHAGIENKRLFELHPFPVLMCDAQGRVVRANRSANQLFGGRPPEHYNVFDEAKAREKKKSDLFKPLEHGATLSLPPFRCRRNRFSLQCQDNDQLWLREHFIPLQGEKDELCRIAVIYEVLSEREERSENLTRRPDANPNPVPPPEVNGKVGGLSQAHDEPSQRENRYRTLSQTASDAEQALRESEQRLREQNRVLVELVRNKTLLGGDSGAAEEITRSVADTLDVARVGLWLLDDSHSRIHCASLYDRNAGKHFSGLELSSTNDPEYFRALVHGLTIVADDARNDFRTRNFSSGYFAKHGITSVINAPLRIGDRIAGFVRLEHVGPPRIWTAEEQSFATSVADFAALAIEARQRRRAETLQASQNRVLELLAKGVTLTEVLRSIVDIIEAQADGMLCSILLLEQHSRRLRTAVAPSLPEAYNRAVDHLEIGPTTGSCGTAAYTCKRVIVEDIARDPLWEEYREIALQHGLRACWSQPIISSKNCVLGTFAMYYAQPRTPTLSELQLIEAAGHLAGIAIELKQSEEALKNAEEKYRGIFENANEGIYQSSAAGTFLTANPMLARILGYDSPQALLAADIDLNREFYVTPNRRKAFIQALRDTGAISNFESIARRKDGSRVWISENARSIRDTDGRIVGFEGTTVDITERKQSEQAVRDWVEFEKLVTHISTHFINLTIEEIDTGINYALQAIGEHAGVDRSYIFLFSDDGTTMTNTHEWCADGIETHMHRLQDLHADTFPYFSEKMRRLEVFHAPSVADLPVDAKAERDEFQAENIQSLLCVPMVSGGILFGFLGFDSVATEKTWGDDSIALLKIVGEIFVNALERKRVEEALRESETRYRTLFEGSSDAIFLYDRAGFVLDANEKACQMFGYSRQELQGVRVGEQLSAEQDSGNQARTLLQRALSGETLSFDWLGRRKDGSTFLEEISLKPITLVGQQYLLGIIRDATDRKQAEKALREQRAFLRQVIDLNPNYIFAKDRSGRYTLVNQAVADTYGTTVEEVIGKRDEDFNKNPEEVENFRRDDLQVMDSRQAKFIPEEPITDAQGRVRFLQTVKIPIIDAGGKAHQVLGVATDITERKRAEEEKNTLQDQLFQSQKMESIGMLAGGIAHDFNNLLEGVMGFASLAMDEVPEDHLAHEPLKLILQSTEKAAKLTRELLAYAQGGPQIREVFDLGKLVTELLYLLRANIPKHVAIERDLCATPLVIEADPAQIQQVIMNLCINAGEAITAGTGKVRISTGKQNVPTPQSREAVEPGAYAFLEVVDTGCGLDPELQAKIFEPFFTTKQFGRGMGLAAVQGIIANHRGSIRVHSSPGNGTKFSVLLPLTAQEAPDSAPAECSDAPGFETILIADDEEVVRKVAEVSLPRSGYRVVSAACGTEAIQIYRKRAHEIDLVVLDLVMPDIRGEEVLREMYEINPDVKVLLSSGYSENIVEQETSHHACHFIQKPYTTQTLARRVREILDQQQV